ncbi:MAG: radical SAM protein [Nitrospinae bacterium]|nr:radical SAM protein [Nitrospinota bacterium]
MTFLPYAVSWNLTSRCNLSCAHCYMDAGARAAGEGEELSTQEALAVVEQIASVNPGAVLILTGGEPLLREDIFEIASRAAGLGLITVVGTNGTLLDAKMAAALKISGVTGVGVSIDSIEPGRHDGFRGAPGAWARSVEGLINARDAGLDIQVQTTPRPGNTAEIPLIAEWAHRMGARAFNLFFLVCTGRGEKMTDISPEEYERILTWASDARAEYPGMMIRPKCAPHFKRIMAQADANDPLLKTYIAACRAGTNYCRIKPDGKITPCPYMDTAAGDLRESEFPLIWRHSPGLSMFRTPEYHGKCGVCAYRLLCGGCRARALASGGGQMGEDPYCLYQPKGVEEPVVCADTRSRFGGEDICGAEWSREAVETMEKIPVFAREIVKQRVEEYAAKHGVPVITSDILRAAAPAPSGAPVFSRKNLSPGIACESVEWDADARARVENAPDFVRPGILKLMAIRARQRGIGRITSGFLSEIRDESMMLVTRRMKKMGFEKLSMEAWDKAKGKFKKDGRKQEVIENIKAMLDTRGAKNENIIEKFGDFFSDDTGEKMGWTPEASKRLESAPEPFRPMARKFIEKFARENGYKYITEEALEKAMERSPFARFSAKK